MQSKIIALTTLLLAGCSGVSLTEVQNAPTYRADLTQQRDWKSAYRDILAKSRECGIWEVNGDLDPDGNGGRILWQGTGYNIYGSIIDVKPKDGASEVLIRSSYRNAHERVLRVVNGQDC